jgi:hypothetical protein
VRVEATIRCGWASSPRLFSMTVSADSLAELACRCAVRVPERRRTCALPSSEPNLIEAVEGVPSWMSRRVRAVLLDAAEGDVQFGQLDALDTLLDQVPLLDQAALAASGGGFEESLLAALETQSFQRTLHEAQFDVESLAARLGEHAETLERWKALLFEKPAVNRLLPADAALLDSVLRGLYQAGDDVLRDAGRFRADGGACGLWASVLNRVLGAGGHYVVFDRPSFDINTAQACSHIALRVGNMVADGTGVHEVGHLTDNWASCWQAVYEVHMPDDEQGLIGWMRTMPAARRLLDESRLEAALLDRGLGAHLLQPLPAPLQQMDEPILLQRR